MTRVCDIYISEYRAILLGPWKDSTDRPHQLFIDPLTHRTYSDETKEWELVATFTDGIWEVTKKEMFSFNKFISPIEAK